MEPLFQRALRIREQEEEARAWYARALAVYERTLGAQQPKTTETRMRLIALLHALKQHEEAARLEATQSEQGSALRFRAAAVDRLPPPSAVPAGPIVVPPRQPVSPVPLQPTSPVPLPAHLEERLTVLREQSPVPVVDPFVGIVPAPSTGNQQLSPVIVQKVQFLNVSPDERQRGFQWVDPADMLKPFEVIVESIFARPGLNHVEVIVVDGQGQHLASQGRVFFLNTVRCKKTEDTGILGRCRAGQLASNYRLT